MPKIMNKPISDYQKKLLDPRWQKKRLEILDRDNWVCTHCGCGEDTLHVHHTYYDKIDPWDYPEWSLTTLCYSCHENETELLKTEYPRLSMALKKYGLTASDVGFLAYTFEKSIIHKNKSDVVSAINYLLNNADLLKSIVDLNNSELSDTLSNLK